MQRHIVILRTVQLNLLQHPSQRVCCLVPCECLHGGCGTGNIFKIWDPPPGGVGEVPPPPAHEGSQFGASSRPQIFEPFSEESPFQACWAGLGQGVLEPPDPPRLGRGPKCTMVGTAQEGLQRSLVWAQWSLFECPQTLSCCSTVNFQSLVSSREQGSPVAASRHLPSGLLATQASSK